MTYGREIEHLIEIGAFQQAYERIVAELVAAADSNKATDGSAEALQLEGFLEKVIELNGEDIYGRLPDHALREER
jgi:hypothetical protein